MVNMNKVKERLVRGAYVGVGSFASSFTGNFLENNVPGGAMATSAGQVALGLGVSVGVDEVFDNPRSMPNEAVEFVGYGIQGAGFANLAETVQPGAQTGNVVDVRERSNNSGSQSSSSGTRQYSLDTA